MRTALISTVFTISILFGATPFAAAAEKSYLIGFAQDDMSNDWRAAQVQAAEQALSQYPNVQFIYTDAEGDIAQNIQDIEDLVDQGIDLLMVGPRNPKAMTPALSSVYDQGIPIVLLTRKVTNDKYTAFIAPNDRAIAVQAAEQLAQAMHGKGKILVLQGIPTATTTIKRTAGFIAGIKPHPGLSIVRTVTANYQSSEAITAVQETLEQGIKFDAIYAQSDSMAVGARLALKAAGLDLKSIPIVGIDYIPEARTAIRAGEQYASFTYPTCGDVGAEIAMQILTGKKTPREIIVPSQRVTRDNVESVETIF